MKSLSDAALRQYQAQHGLPVTAVLDDATRTVG